MANTPRIIKKYANRRLYDTEISQSITLQDVRDLIAGGESIQVLEARSEKDVTRSVLVQIVADQELLGQPILSNAFLEGLIRLDSVPLKDLSRDFLEAAMAQLQSQQQHLEDAWTATFRGTSVDEFTQSALAPAKQFQRRIFELWTDARRPASRSTKNNNDAD
jgi:polyhydroxyalkanoate synthesis repressor PhaR